MNEDAFVLLLSLAVVACRCRVGVAEKCRTTVGVALILPCATRTIFRSGQLLEPATRETCARAQIQTDVFQVDGYNDEEDKRERQKNDEVPR